MMKPDENLLHLGADLDKDFVLSFRDYCRLNDFKQKTIVQRLVEWWLSLDPINQEHIYRGRELGAHEQISEEAQSQAVEDENAAADDSAKRKRKQGRKSSKSA